MTFDGIGMMDAPHILLVMMVDGFVSVSVLSKLAIAEPFISTYRGPALYVSDDLIL